MTEADERRMTLPVEPVVVVHADAPGGAWKQTPAVGVVRFRRPDEHLLSVIVKLTLTGLDAEGRLLSTARLADVQAPLWVDRPSRFEAATAAGLLDYASDFAPRKKMAELLLVGHASSPTPVDTIAGAFRVDGVGLPFVARSGSPTRSIPLVAPYVDMQGHSWNLAPRADPVRVERPRYLEEDDFSEFNAASHLMHFPPHAIRADSELELVGLWAGAPRHLLALPGIAPTVTVDTAHFEALPVEMVLDTVWLDADTLDLVVVWRGAFLLVEGGYEVDRVVVSMEHVKSPRPPIQRMSDLMRGRIELSGTEELVTKGEAPPADDPRLIAARYATWAAPAPEPRLTLEQYALIGAQVAEDPDHRTEVLARHGLDEDGWMTEERGWVERFSAEVSTGGSELVTRFGQLSLSAQDSLRTPEERTMTLAQYAELSAAMDRTADPGILLKERGITLGKWMRVERDWAARASADSAVAAELERLLARYEEEAEDEDASEPIDKHLSGLDLDEESDGDGETQVT